jgi:hypothetical protein
MLGTKFGLVVRVLVVALVSVPLGFLWLLSGYQYAFVTPGMYIAAKFIQFPPSEGWSKLGEVFFVGMAVDAICCFVVIWVLLALVRKASHRIRSSGKGHSSSIIEG